MFSNFRLHELGVSLFHYRSKYQMWRFSLFTVCWHKPSATYEGADAMADRSLFSVSGMPDCYGKWGFVGCDILWIRFGTWGFSLDRWLSSRSRS